MLLDTAAMYRLCFRFSGEMMGVLQSMRIENFYDGAPRKNVNSDHRERVSP